MFTTYAQNFEDLMLWRALKHLETGFYVDIGAQDPIIDSVSLAFYERGWRGVHVEPVPTYAERLREERKDETVIQAAVGMAGPLIKFFEVSGSGWSTGDSGVARGYSERGVTFKEREVPCVTLSSILNSYSDREVHWLKIDVEGMEDSVIASWTPSTVRPWILVLEATKPTTQIPSYHDWEPKVTALGYTFAYFDGLNRYYVSEGHAELLAAFASPPNVFDGFILSGTSQNPACSSFNQTLTQLRNEREQLRNALASSEQKLVETQERFTVERSEMDAMHKKSEVTYLRKLEEMRGLVDKLTTERHQLMNDWKERLFAETAESGKLLKVALQAQRDLLDRVNTSESEIRKYMERLAKRERRIVEIHRMRVAEAKIARESAAAAAAREEELVAKLAHAADVHVKYENLLRDVSKLLSSWSWRITAPVRWFEADPRSISTKIVGLVPPNLINSVRAQGTVHLDPVKIVDLIRKDGEEFIASAYAAILHRSPDPQGQAHYQSILETGTPKIQVLANLVMSPEGRRVNAGLIGFKWRYWTYKLLQIARFVLRYVVGRFVPSSARPTQSVDKLLMLRGKVFVQEAYRIILQRSADDEGLKNYLSVMQAGASKIQVIKALKNSAEGRKDPVRLRGFFRAQIFDGATRVPVVGRVLQAWVKSRDPMVWCKSHQRWCEKIHTE